MRENLETLTSLVGLPPPDQGHPDRIRQLFLELPHEEVETRCFAALCKWLWVSLEGAVDNEKIKSLLKKGEPGLTTTISFLNVLTEAWATVEPSPNRRTCIELVINLLLQVVNKKKERVRAVHDELLGAYLLCYGAQEIENRSLLDHVEDTFREEVWSRSDLYNYLESKTFVGFDEVANEIQRRYFAASVIASA